MNALYAAFSLVEAHMEVSIAAEGELDE